MDRRFPSRQTLTHLTALALGLGSLACGDSDGPESPIIQQFLDAASAGSTTGTPRSGIPPRSGGGGGILSEFLNRVSAGGTSRVVVHSSTPVARMVIAIENALNYYEIIPPSPFLDGVSGVGLPSTAGTPSATRAVDVIVSLRFASAPPTSVFNLRIAAASTADGPLGEYTRMPVDLTGTADPVIRLTPTTVSLTAVQGASLPPAQNVAVENMGTGTLDRLSLGTIAFTPSGTAWLNVSLKGPVAPTTVNVAATTTNLAPGTYGASVPVESPAARETPRNFTVTYVVTPPPSIVLSRDEIAFGARVRGENPKAEVVNISNGGSGTLSGLSLGPITFTPTNTPVWLTATLRSATAPTTVELQASVFNLTRGTYTATVPVRTSMPNVGQKTIRVQFNVDS